MLEDLCGRQVYNLRISVTQECNQSCMYCHREGEGERGPRRSEERRVPDSGDCDSRGLMTADEIERAARIAASLGVFKVKFTGGEPLTRMDLPDIIRRVAPHFRDCSLTTNGTLLAAPPKTCSGRGAGARRSPGAHGEKGEGSAAGGEKGAGSQASALKAAGLMRVNISLDSLKRGTYRTITGTDRLDEALKGVKAAAEAHLSPVKLNMVLLKGLNEDELPDMMRFAAGNGAILQLIELEGPKGSLSGDWFSRYHLDLGAIESEFRSAALKVETRKMHHRSKYHMKIGCGLDVEVEVVRPVHNSEFCANCTRLRLSSEGMLVPCLFRRDLAVDLLGPMRKGASDRELRRLFIESVSRREPYWKGDVAVGRPRKLRGNSTVQLSSASKGKLGYSFDTTRKLRGNSTVQLSSASKGKRVSTFDASKSGRRAVANEK